MAAGVLGLSPVLAGRAGPTAFNSGLEAGVGDQHTANHAGVNSDLRGDRIRNARCANEAYRARNRPRCPKITSKRARAERLQRNRCRRVSYRRKNPSLCPQAGRAIKRALAQQPADVTGRWTGQIQIDGLAINSTLLPTGKVLWFAYRSKPDWTPPHTPASDEALNYVDAYVFDPATNTSVRRDPPTDPRTGKPFNLWCGGQTFLRDGRLVVAGGNLAYYSNASPKYRGLDVVVTFNPFNETWTYQGRMRDGRWYPTLVELADGRVVIVAGLDSGGVDSEFNNPDVEVFTPSADMNGVGTIERKPTAERFFGLYPHLFLTPAGKVLALGPQGSDSAILDPATWTWQDTPNFSVRREWGSAVPLPSGPGGPTTIMMTGGSNTNIDYNNAPATASTLLVNTTTGAISAGPSNIRGRSHVNTVVLPDGKLLSVGGGVGSDDGSLYEGPVFTAELYNPATGTWTETDPQADERTYHSTALLLPDGRVISMGDDRQAHSQNVSQRTLEYYSPPYLYKGARPTISSAPAGAAYNTTVQVTTPDAASVTKAVLLKLGATTHAVDSDQRSLEMTVSQVAGGVAFTTPSSLNAAPPGYYMLFLVNGQGVPSVAKIIRIDTNQGGPGDTTAPTVSVSAPAAGATVSGTTPVNATAADNVGVAGVQFTLDGANLGAEDTSAPYSVSWNTTTTANGTHALRAIARDAAGNATTSAPVSVTVSNSTPPPAAGLVGAYGFEETSGAAVTDSSSANNPGTIVGAAARTAAGKIGRAIDFDGVNDYVSVADAASLDLTTGMTLEAWVQLDTVSSWRTTILKEKPGGLVYSLYANSSSARPQGEIVTGAGTDVLAGAGPALTAGTWTHLALTYDNAQLRLFRNGVQVAQIAATGAIQASTLPLRIGGNAIWGEYTDGRIDEVRVYNRALSAAEITTDMTTPVGGGGPPPPDSTPPTVSVSSPAGGASVQGTIPVNATAADNVAVAGVQFTLDGANLGAEDTSAPYSVSWNTTTATNGTHVLRAIARDAATNSTTSTPVSVTVANPVPDTTPPTVSVSSPAEGATVLGSVPVNASASDNVGVTSVQFTLDGANLGAADTSAPYSVSWNTATAANGAHVLRAIARDAATNSTTSAPVNVTVNNPAPDTTPPTVAVSAPAAGATVSGTTPVSANASDNVGRGRASSSPSTGPTWAPTTPAPPTRSAGTPRRRPTAATPCARSPATRPPTRPPRSRSASPSPTPPRRSPAWWAPTASRRPPARPSPTPRAPTTPAPSPAPPPAPPPARSAARSTSTGSTTTSRWPTPTASISAPA